MAKMHKEAGPQSRRCGIGREVCSYNNVRCSFARCEAYIVNKWEATKWFVIAYAFAYIACIDTPPARMENVNLSHSLSFFLWHSTVHGHWTWLPFQIVMNWLKFISNVFLSCYLLHPFAICSVQWNNWACWNIDKTMWKPFFWFSDSQQNMFVHKNGMFVEKKKLNRHS